jgi:hypothetical protein
MSAACGDWTIFKVVDACGQEFLTTGTQSYYEPAFRRHVAWWRRYARSQEYRDKVPAYRWPVFPVRIVIEPAA